MTARRLLRLAFLLALTLLAGLVHGNPARAAQLTGAVDHTFMSERETFEYVVSLAGGDGRVPPETAPLNRDFEIIKLDRRDRFESTATGRVQVKEWVMILAPRRTGTLTVPGLSVNGLTSAPLKIDVVPALPVEQPDDGQLFVRVDVGNVSPYAQSLIPVVIRIFDSVGMRRGRLGQPSAEGASLTPEGSQRTYVRTIGSKRYGVIEQSFLMQPQKSGTVEIAPVTVEAAVPATRNPATSALPNLLGRGAFTSLDTEEVKFSSRSVSVEVKPRPPGVEGWFLPARAVTLSQEWSSPPAKAQVGVALTRTLRLKARGASPNQLPPLPVTEVEGVRQYEDEGRSERVMIDGSVGAQLETAISVVPTRPGTLTLPAITVSWWNTDKARLERAELPPVTLTIAPEAGGAPAAATPVAVPSAELPAGQEPSAEATPLLARLLALAMRHAPALGAILAFAVVLVVLLRWRRAAAQRRAEAAPPTPAPIARPRAPRPVRHPRMRAPVYDDADAAERALARACREDDAQAAHNAFLAWLRLAADQGAGRFHTPRMALAVRTLSEALYGVEEEHWRGRDFLAAFQAEKKAHRKSARIARRARIAPLYPAG